MLSPGYDIIKTKSLVLRAFWGLYYLKRIPASGDGTEQGQVKETNYGKSIAKSKKVQEEKMGIAKQSCLCSPHGAGMNQAKSNATFLVSNVKMMRISL